MIPGWLKTSTIVITQILRYDFIRPIAIHQNLIFKSTPANAAFT